MSAARRRCSVAPPRRLARLFLCGAALPLLLSSCVVAGLPAVGGAPAIQEIRGGGNKELILEPVDAWDDAGAGEAQEMAVNGAALYFRPRPTKSFDQAWVRLGLFWHSKQKGIHMPVVIAGGAPVKIQQVRVETDSGMALLKEAENFSFTPGKRLFDKTLSGGVFTMSPKMLARMVQAKDAHVTIGTDRGALRVNLSAVPDTSAAALAASAKYQFAEFARRRQALQ